MDFRGRDLGEMMTLDACKLLKMANFSLVFKNYTKSELAQKY
jgi:hypothetical protein